MGVPSPVPPHTMAAGAALHCLTGCALGEIAGLVHHEATQVRRFIPSIATSTRVVAITAFLLGGLTVSLAA